MYSTVQYSDAVVSNDVSQHQGPQFISWALVTAAFDIFYTCPLVSSSSPKLNVCFTNLSLNLWIYNMEFVRNENELFVFDIFHYEEQMNGTQIPTKRLQQYTNYRRKIWGHCGFIYNIFFCTVPYEKANQSFLTFWITVISGWHTWLTYIYLNHTFFCMLS